MSKESSARDTGRYHHGDLRRDLLQVARAEIARHGSQTVSLSSLARLAGVSQPAPYRHFADRDALLEAVATEGFEEFTAILIEAVKKSTPADALERIARAYVMFGEENVEIYRLMFASRVTPQATTGSELDEAAGTAFGLLREALSSSSMRPIADEETYLTWARLHGLVMLKADGFIRRPLVSYLAATPSDGVDAGNTDGEDALRRPGSCYAGTRP